MAPKQFDLAVRTKPVPKSNSTAISKQNRTVKPNRISKSATKSTKTLVEFPDTGAVKMAFDSSLSQLNVKQRRHRTDRSIAPEDFETITKAFANTRLADTQASNQNRTNLPRNPHCQPPPKPSLITSDAAGDTLATLLNKTTIRTGPAIHVHFHSRAQAHSIADPLTIDPSAAPDLLSLVNLMHSRRSSAFRESEFMKLPPIEWHFTVNYSCIEETYDDNGNAIGRVITRERFREVCVNDSFEGGGETQNDPHAAYRTFLSACQNQDLLRVLLRYSEPWIRESGVSVEREMEEVKKERSAGGDRDGDLLEDGEEVFGRVDVYFR